MARASVNMENHSCDDRKCSVEATAPAGDNHAPAGWFTGTAAQADADGNLPVEAKRVIWEACRAPHIRGAVQAALEGEGVAPDDEPDDEPAEPDETSLASSLRAANGAAALA